MVRGAEVAQAGRCRVGAGSRLGSRTNTPQNDRAPVGGRWPTRHRSVHLVSADGHLALERCQGTTHLFEPEYVTLDSALDRSRGARARGRTEGKDRPRYLGALLLQLQLK